MIVDPVEVGIDCAHVGVHGGEAAERTVVSHEEEREVPARVRDRPIARYEVLPVIGPDDDVDGRLVWMRARGALVADDEATVGGGLFGLQEEFRGQLLVIDLHVDSRDRCAVGLDDLARDGVEEAVLGRRVGTRR